MILGMNGKLYYSATALDGDTDTPSTVSWVEIDNVADLNLSMEAAEAEATTRANDGWRQTLAALKEGSIEFEMNWAPGETAFDAIKTAFLNSSEIAMAALDGAQDTSGSEGLASNFTVTGFTRNEPLEEVMKVSVTIKPSSQTQWYTVS